MLSKQKKLKTSKTNSRTRKRGLKNKKTSKVLVKKVNGLNKKSMKKNKVGGGIGVFKRLKNKFFPQSPPVKPTLGPYGEPYGVPLYKGINIFENKYVMSGYNNFKQTQMDLGGFIIFRAFNFIHETNPIKLEDKDNIINFFNLLIDYLVTNKIIEEHTNNFYLKEEIRESKENQLLTYYEDLLIYILDRYKLLGNTYSANELRTLLTGITGDKKNIKM